MAPKGKPAPDWTLGLWQRSLVEGDGIDAVERAKTVYWAQTPYAFVDLRMPPVTGGHAINPAAQDGFAGHVSFVADVCTWHRVIDLNPSGAADRAHLRRVGDTLEETGDGYREEFVLDCAGLSRCLGFGTADGRNILVVIDGVFLSAFSQNTPGAVPEVSMGHVGPPLWVTRSTAQTQQDRSLFDDDVALPDRGSFFARYRGEMLAFHNLATPGPVRRPVTFRQLGKSS